MSSDLIAVAGLGLLGRGIATCLLAHGFRVIAYTKDDDGYATARTYIENGLRELVDRGYSPETIVEEWPRRYIESPSLQEFAPATFVIESVTEDLEIKQQVFTEIESVVGSDVPIASNTSALPITLLQTGRTRPERFLGMHWAGPAYATRFLELIRGKHTSDATMDTAAALGRRVGKDASIVQKDVAGFIVNRLGYAMYREAVYLLESGVGDVEAIDRSFQNACGLWASLCGPLRWIDITGGPALYAKAMRGVLPMLNNNPDLPKTLEEMEHEGYRGVLDGRGFYSYSPGDAERWSELLHQHVWAIRELQERERSPGTKS